MVIIVMMIVIIVVIIGLIQFLRRIISVSLATAALTSFSLLVIWKMGGWWRWAVVGLAGVTPSRMVCVSASVNLPLYHEVLFWHRLTRVVQEKGQ